MALFDAYVMVDWSAAAVPTTGRDSIWIAIAAARSERAENPPTRGAAMASLRATLLRLRGQGKRVLVGFDFPFGYPAGFAAALGLEQGNWRALWRFFADAFADGADNANDRFRVAGRINRERFGGLFPFWGHPPGRRIAGLSKGKRHSFAQRPFAERRACELRPCVRARAAPRRSGSSPIRAASAARFCSACRVSWRCARTKRSATTRGCGRSRRVAAATTVRRS